MKNRLQGVKSFAVYYGRGEVSSLQKFDLVIVEPSHITDEDVLSLRTQGTKVVGYVSVMELSQHHSYFGEAKPEDYLLAADGSRIMQKEYQTFIMNLESAHWRGIVLHQIGELLTRRGYDGVFLDTIGDVESPHLPNAWAQIDAAAQFVHGLRRIFKHSILIQNNGLEVLCLQTAPSIDGIVWENAPIGTKESEAWLAATNERLNVLYQKHGIRLMLLFDGIERMKRRDWLVRQSFADSYPYLVHFAQTHYLGSPQFVEPTDL